MLMLGNYQKMNVLNFVQRRFRELHRLWLVNGQTSLRSRQVGMTANGGIKQVKKSSMPKIYKYFGIVFLFHARDHQPIHIHGRKKGAESKAEIIIKYNRENEKYIF